MKKYIGTCFLFLFNSEILSLLALLVLAAMAITDLTKEVLEHGTHS